MLGVILVCRTPAEVHQRSQGSRLTCELGHQKRVWHPVCSTVRGAMMLIGALLMYKLVQQAFGCDAEAFVPGLRGSRIAESGGKGYSWGGRGGA